MGDVLNVALTDKARLHRQNAYISRAFLSDMSRDSDTFLKHTERDLDAFFGRDKKPKGT